ESWSSNSHSARLDPGVSIEMRIREPTRNEWANGNTETRASTHPSAGTAATSASAWVWTGASSVDLPSSSARSLTRSQPDCTYISCPSGRTSEMLTSTSASPTELRIHRSALAGPTITRSWLSTSLTNTTAVSVSSSFQFHDGSGVLMSPPGSMLVRESIQSTWKLEPPTPSGGIVVESVPSGWKYQRSGSTSSGGHS